MGQQSIVLVIVSLNESHFECDYFLYFIKIHNLLNIIEHNKIEEYFHYFDWMDWMGLNNEMVNWKQCAHSWTRGYSCYAFIVGGLASEIAIFCSANIERPRPRFYTKLINSNSLRIELNYSIWKKSSCGDLLLESSKLRRFYNRLVYPTHKRCLLLSLSDITALSKRWESNYATRL